MSAEVLEQIFGDTYPMYLHEPPIEAPLRPRRSAAHPVATNQKPAKSRSHGHRGHTISAI